MNEKQLKPLYIKKYNSMVQATSVELAVAMLGFILDSAIAGHLVGMNGLAAMTIIAPFAAVRDFLALLLENGFAMQFGRAVGEFDRLRAEKIFGMAMITAVVLGALLSLCYRILVPLGMNMANIDPEIQKQA